MKDNDQTPPPAPDPFEAIAQQLATLAAGIVQIAGAIAKLKDAGQTPPPPPAEPEQQDDAPPSEEETPDKDAEPPTDEPKDAPEGEESTQDPQHDEPTESEAEGPKDEADEGTESEQTEQAKPDADNLQESEQDGKGEELENAPDAPAEEQGAEPQDSDEAGAEGEQTAENADSDAQEADGGGEGEDAPDGAESTEDGDGSEDGETQDSPETDGGEAGEQPEGEETDADEPEHVESENEVGEGSGTEESADSEAVADNDGKGQMAALPPDLPPLDSTLASCSPPPSPEAVPYRPLSPTARKVADILTGALGKRFSLPRADRHTGQLSAQAVARHAPDVFRRRPRMDGRRPKLTIISDTSGSMSLIHSTHGADLLDGLLEAHRRRVIDLRLYDSERAAECRANAGQCVDKTGLFVEAQAKELMKGSAEYTREFTQQGILPCNGGNEGFAKALVNLKPVIRESDATILFTDGHWTDGALDKVAYQCEGVEVVGLYIPLGIAKIRKYRNAMMAEIEAAPDSGRADLQARMARFESLAGVAQIAAQEMQKAAQAWSAARITQDECRSKKGVEANKAADAEVERACRVYEDSAEKAQRATDAATSIFTKELGRNASRILNEGVQIAAARAALEMNSHRSYCVENAVECAQAIVQEIARQIETK